MHPYYLLKLVDALPSGIQNHNKLFCYEERQLWHIIHVLVYLFAQASTHMARWELRNFVMPVAIHTLNSYECSVSIHCISICPSGKCLALRMRTSTGAICNIFQFESRNYPASFLYKTFMMVCCWWCTMETIESLSVCEVGVGENQDEKVQKNPPAIDILPTMKYEENHAWKWPGDKETRTYTVPDHTTRHWTPNRVSYWGPHDCVIPQKVISMGYTMPVYCSILNRNHPSYM